MKPSLTDTMTEVWESKRGVFEETSHLRGAAYFRFLRQEAAVLFPGIRTQRNRARNRTNELVASEYPRDLVAESGANYRVGNMDRT